MLHAKRYMSTRGMASLHGERRRDPPSSARGTAAAGGAGAGDGGAGCSGECVCEGGPEDTPDTSV